MLSTVCNLRLRGLVFALLGLVSQVSVAYIHTVTGQLNLLATIDGKPAFEEVTWELKPLHAVNKPALTIARHSAVIDLEAGRYQVLTIWGNTTKTQQITIVEGKHHKLVVNLK